MSEQEYMEPYNWNDVLFWFDLAGYNVETFLFDKLYRITNPKGHVIQGLADKDWMIDQAYNIWREYYG